MYMLDTNIASLAMSGSVPVRLRMLATPRRDLCISQITLAELEYGAKRVVSAKVSAAFVQQVASLAAAVQVMPWEAAESYAELRIAGERQGRALAEMDMLIVAHAFALGAILVTADRDLHNFRPKLKLDDWSC